MRVRALFIAGIAALLIISLVHGSALSSTGSGINAANFAAPSATPISSCQTIGSSGDYVLTGDITTNASTCIIIAANNVNLDCIDHSVTGAGLLGGYGIALTTNHSTVKNCIVEGFDHGISIGDPIASTSGQLNNTIYNNTGRYNQFGFGISSAHYNTIENNIGEDNSDGGIVIGSSQNNTIRNNLFRNNDRGIIFWQSDVPVSGNSIHRNFIIANNRGLHLDQQNSDNLIFNNYIDNPINVFYAYGTNSWNITKTPGTNVVGGTYIAGNYWSDYNGTDLNGDGVGDTETPYTAGGKLVGGDYAPLYYLPPQIPVSSCQQIPENGHYILSTDLFSDSSCLEISSGGVYLDCNGHDIIGTNNTVPNAGVNISAGNHVVVENCRIEGFGYGIYSDAALTQFYGNTLINNTYGLVARYTKIENNIVDRNQYGINLLYIDSGNNFGTIRNNSVFNSTSYGIRVYGGTGTFSENVVENNLYGFSGGFGFGYDVDFINNSVRNNGIGFYLPTAFSGDISSNTITGSGHGIYFWRRGSYNSNYVIYNNYFNNTINAFDELPGSAWNITKMPGKNIIGGDHLAGNFWHDYAGTDNDGDGIGDTDIPYNSGGNIPAGGDYAPLTYICGDLNKDWQIDVVDVVSIVNIAFRGGAPPDPSWIADINGDGIISDILDVVGLVNHAFRGQPAPTCGI